MCVIVTLRKFILALCVISTAFYLSIYLFLSYQGKAVAAAPDRKLVLSWTGFFHFPKFMLPNSLSKMGCPVHNCDVTNNRTLLNESHAVVFHWPNVNVSDLPVKLDSQKWSMVSFETPVHFPTRREAADILGSNIDWTVTYRFDSDIVSPYGRYRPRSVRDGPTPVVPSLAQFAKKSKVSWMASNCHTRSKREAIVGQIRSHIRVDKYGKCGGKRQMLRWNRDRAYKYLADRYLFYLSFENAVCKDYVTEKAFLPLYFGLIPVVYGGANYKRQLPPKSYIDILDFPTPVNLAEYLHNVSSNYSLYSQYFKWRNEYVISRRSNDNRFFCKLCARLNEQRTEVPRGKGWFRLWWFNTKQCLDVRKGNVFDLKAHKDKRSRWYWDNEWY